MAQVRDTIEERSVVIATIAHPTSTSETNALLLTESMRAFGGSLSSAPIWCFTPENESPVSAFFKRRLDSLDVVMVPFQMARKSREFAFAGHVHAAANAESKAMAQVELLVWLAPNTLVLQEPRNFLLQRGKSLGYRPVHHKLLGSGIEEPLDEFWTLIYEHCGVPEDQVFAMRTQIEDIPIRPYFNAGSLIVEPDTKILQTWLDTFLRIFQKAEYLRFYNQDKRYEIFMHQAVLTGVFLSNLAKKRMVELPPSYNYPLNLYAEDKTKNRPESLEDCVTIRHEGFYEDSKWMEKIPARKLLKDWIAERLPQA
ncbi:MAG: hypothetical protein JSW05_01180 [Candidatus Thorarchaeota archaeon]|nr:MAG: hypothetical protein JSW05_01180 [Candidatus Thorarchaeota archaeon]